MNVARRVMVGVLLRSTTAKVQVKQGNCYWRGPARVIPFVDILLGGWRQPDDSSCDFYYPLTPSYVEVESGEVVPLGIDNTPTIIDGLALKLKTWGQS